MNDIFDSIEIQKSINGYTLNRKSAIKLIENLLVKINNKIDIVKCSIKENRKELKLTGWDIYECITFQMVGNFQYFFLLLIFNLVKLWSRAHKCRCFNFYIFIGTF